MNTRIDNPGNLEKSNRTSFLRKSLSRLLTVFVFMGLLFVSCDDDPTGTDGPDPEPEVEASFTADPENPSIGDEVTLNASGSSVTYNGDIEYSWTLNTPEGSEAELESETSEITSFPADVAGEFNVNLVVTANGASDGAAESLDVTAEEEI